MLGWVYSQKAGELFGVFWSFLLNPDHQLCCGLPAPGSRITHEAAAPLLKEAL